MKQIAVVTGASGGFGKEFVRLLVQRKDLDEIWVISRNAEKLEQLREQVDCRIVPCPMDLSDRSAADAFARRLEQADAAVVMLINNAGFAKFCSYSDISVEESLNMINLNVSAVVAMGLICIPYMPQGSHIINVASQASFQPLPYMNLYAATKAFVRNYSRALNVELKDKQITVTAVCPGWMKTALFERGSIGAKKAPTVFSNMVTPDVVARKALRDAMKGRDISVYGLYVKVCHLAAKLLPQRWMMKFWLIQQKQR